MEVENINIANKNIKYFLKNSHRAKRVRLTIYADGRLLATKPKNVSSLVVRNFIRKKSSWIIKRVSDSNVFDDTISNNNYYKNKKRALIFVEKKVKFFNQNYNFKYNQVKVKNQKTCWGSCSAKYNLNFNYKIIFLPEKIANYVIVHELCHLKELNHSSRFWSLVAKTIPDYLEIRKELRRVKLKF